MFRREGFTACDTKLKLGCEVKLFTILKTRSLHSYTVAINNMFKNSSQQY